MRGSIQHIVALGLLYALSWQFYGQLNLVLHYQLNKKQLTDLYCVNKEIPELSCYARCYLASELEKQGTMPESTSLYDLTFSFSTLFWSDCRPILPTPVYFLATDVEKPHTHYSGLRSQCFGGTLFHPPIVA